jgi:hypothetical protein
MNNTSMVLPDAKELAIKEFEITLDTAKYESTLYWQRFNVVLVVESVIIGALGLVIANHYSEIQNFQFTIFILGLCFLGILTSLSILFANRRAQKYHQYWWTHLEEIQKSKLIEFTLLTKRKSFLESDLIAQIPIITLSHIFPVCFCIIFVIIPAIFSLQFLLYFYLLSLVIFILFLIWAKINFWNSNKKK